MKTRMRMTLAIVAAAAALAAGATAAAAASSPGAARVTRQAAAAAFTWTPLKLKNGWTAVSGSTYGSPSYAVRNGVLYLRGILSAPASGEPEFAVLPSGARPAHYLWLSYTNFGGDDIGQMEIEPSGEMFAYQSTTGGPAIDPSLAAISFPLSS
jgi:hypothetical protein